MKLWERVIERRISQETVIRENHGFMPGRSTIKTIHVLRRLMKKYREQKMDLHIVFIDLEKADRRAGGNYTWRSYCMYDYLHVFRIGDSE